MLNRKSRIKNQEWPALRARRLGGFTLVEILVAVGVLAILGTALVGLMSAAMTAWRRGEASRQLHEKLQTLRHQVADDLAAAVVDPPPVPDFHYALDTLWDLPTDESDPYYIIRDGKNYLAEDTSSGHDARYFAPIGASSSATVTLRVRVPFTIGAALLKARMDAFDKGAYVGLQVARNDPNGADPEVPLSGSWQEIGSLNPDVGTDLAVDGAIGGAEADISAVAQGGTIVFIRATLEQEKDDTARFLFGGRLRSEGRPVLILDCYRDPDALPLRPRPVFTAFWRDQAQVVAFARTIPGENEKAALRNAGSGGTEYLNHFDDDGNHVVDDNLRALGGRGQVVYRVVPYPASESKAGLGILRRAFEAPLGRALEDVPAHDFLTSVLHFSMAFWGGDTTVWETRPELEPGYDTKYDETNVPHPPSQRWLSSRYLPEQVLVTVVLEPDRGRRSSAGLRQDIAADFPAGDTGLVLLSDTSVFSATDHVADFTHAFVRDPRHYFKIGGEWIYYDRVDKDSSDTLVVPAAGRGARGTLAQAHESGAEVYGGRTFVFTVDVPAYRHWRR